MSNKVSLIYTDINSTAQSVAVGTPLPVTAVSSTGAPQVIDTNGAGLVVQEDAVNFNNAILSNGTVTAGLFSTGTITNPSANQIILGPIDTKGAKSFSFQLFSTSGTIPAITFQTSDLLVGPYTTINIQASSTNQGPIGTVSVGNNGIYEGPVKHRYIQIISVAATGVFSLQGYLRSSEFVPMYSTQSVYTQVVTNTLNGVSGGAFAPPAITSSKYAVSTLYTTPDLSWQYSTGGTPITTAATTILQPAAAAGVRNYIDGIQLYNTGALGTVIQILDGAAIIWEGFIGAAVSAVPGKIEISQLGVPLRGTAATAINLKTVSGTTISITGGVQGYQAF